MTDLPFRQLSADVFVAPQIRLSDIDAIIQAGFSTVVCHRPDEELSGVFPEAEPKQQTVKELLATHAIDFIYQPIAQLTLPDVEQFSATLKQSNSPLLAYCTSGTRSTLLWALVQTIIEQQPREQVIAAAQQAGYDISRYL